MQEEESTFVTEIVFKITTPESREGEERLDLGPTLGRIILREMMKLILNYCVSLNILEVHLVSYYFYYFE